MLDNDMEVRQLLNTLHYTRFATIRIWKAEKPGVLQLEIEGAF